jgi:hypothetical protein
LLEATESADHCFWDELKLDHPGSKLPPPSSDPNPKLFNPEGQEIVWDSIDLQGLDICMDGSCARHVVRDLSRAAFAWVFLDPSGSIVAYAQGTVLDVLQQTPQAAEHQAMALRRGHGAIHPEP